MDDLFKDIIPRPELRKVALFMESGWGYSTPDGITFDRERPYQVVDQSEVQTLMETGRFRIATKEEIVKFYGIEGLLAL